ncbi:DEAD/DEAH box helicase [Pseudomonas oryzihabitans]|uniref:DEAD/DEAH box helicase n=1 Tax=Pseudomonas oryzihabitans TaxID=47885 RepID=UPI002866FA48|nr:DEAD/DEAH box helicase [Pseudomonas psychrotolerans]MDR6676003.1 ATP-dependent Lhr-like helicase [Pseudomonas psychrotolerans]
MTSISPAAAVLADFHDAPLSWFRGRFPAPTEAQRQAWPAIRAGESVLVAAPTGSGKTMTAFFAVLDGLVQEALRDGGLPEACLWLYVSPLKALSNDIRLNLEEPLAGIAAALEARGLPPLQLRTAVRTGDTPQKERAAMRRRPPHLLVTTPESLYVLLGSDSGRQMLASVRGVIVDEIHAIADGKRGSHLTLSLARLEALTGRPLQRIGLSATQKPLAAVAAFLVGRDALGQPRRCTVVDIGHQRARDLALEVPPIPLEAILSTQAWELVYDRLAELAEAHRTTLVFVNTRRLAERMARQLADRLGNDQVAAHHGSLAKEQRLDAEQRLKRGELRLLLATASLELGIDIGDVDLVCQIGSPGSIAAFLQRVGRANHQVGGLPKGRLFPTSRDDLVECVALLDCVRRGELDTLAIPRAPLDVLAQQLVAEVACQEWSEAALLAVLRQAEPYAELSEPDYRAVVEMLSQGYSYRRGPRAAYVHRDAVNGLLRGRRGGKATAVMSGGTIPESGDFSVLLEPQGHTVGSVNEDFAFESLVGDVFQLGNTAYRIVKIEGSKVRVEDAKGQPPNIPFWHGEAPGRSDELSAGLARLRAELEPLLPTAGEAPEPAIERIGAAYELTEGAARQLVDYLGRARQALGALPTQQTLVMERFFDQAGGMQLIIHAPFGSRINRAWGLALRKRFCRNFNVELQAAATENALILSLATSHSFVLDEVWRYLHPATAEQVLIQALLDAPLFAVRWRWNATTALALPRFSGGRKVATQVQRMRSEDLLATVFPDQVACLENLTGERQVPEHPLVRQTLDDCLHESLDSRGWLALLERISQGRLTLLTRDLPGPSPLAAEVLTARPYAYLDDAPVEERRTLAVQNRRFGGAEPDELGALDPAAIALVREEAWPRLETADELHEALLGVGFLTEAEVASHPAQAKQLTKAGRAGRLRLPETTLWIAAERLPLFQRLFPEAPSEPALEAPPGFVAPADDEAALVEVLRARLTALGPIAQAELAASLGLPPERLTPALLALQGEGYVLQGHFTPEHPELEWCERHLLARIHRYTLGRLRKAIEPVALADYLRFLLEHHHLAGPATLRGGEGLEQVVGLLEGFEVAAAGWEGEILPSRLPGYLFTGLDDLCRAGRVVWLRLPLPGRHGGGPVKSSPIVLLPRRHLADWNSLATPPAGETLSPKAQRVLEVLTRRGASFFDELLGEARLLRSELETALGELVGAGAVNADSFAGLRALLQPAAKRGSRNGLRRGRIPLYGGMDDAGRWAALRPAESPADARLPDALLERLVWVLLRRYGVLCWQVLQRESEALPPWRDLLRACHRLEARGEIRGGRFIAGLSGEQFADPAAIAPLREWRQRPADDTWVSVSALDPLNLVGTLLPGAKVPAVLGNRLLYRDGVPIAARIGTTCKWLVELSPDDQARARQALLQLGRERPRASATSSQGLWLPAMDLRPGKAAMPD